MNDKYIYYKDTDGNIKYNSSCESCNHECKQSFRSTIISCPIIKLNKKGAK